MPQTVFQTGKVPGPYLALLEDISATALVVVLSVPTFREQRHPEPCAKARRSVPNPHPGPFTLYLHLAPSR